MSDFFGKYLHNLSWASEMKEKLDRKMRFCVAEARKADFIPYTTENGKFKPNTAYNMADMLQNAVENGTGTEARLSSTAVAGKTGTTSDDYDRWFCGFSPYYVLAVWSGYEMPSTMYYSGNPAAQIWRRIMAPINENLPVIQFNDPSNRGSDTGIFGNLEVTPEPTATPAPIATPIPTVVPTATPIITTVTPDPGGNAAIPIW